MAYEPIHQTIEYTANMSQSVIPRKYSSTEDADSCIKTPIFYPFGQYISYWNSFLLIILTYSIVEIPYVLAFEIIPNPWDPLCIIGLFIDLCLLFDIILNFRTAYIDKYDRLRIIHDPKLIANRYLKRCFVVDVISSFPIELIMGIITAYYQLQQNEDQTLSITFQYIHMVFRVIKLLRLSKLYKKFGILKEITHSLYHLDRKQKTVLKLTKIIVCMLLVAHFFACIWYSIGNYSYKHNHSSWIDIIIQNEDGNNGNFTKYSYAFYWAIVTLFTTGYGDIHAVNIYEQWFASVGIIFGSCLFAYFIGVLTHGLDEDLRHQTAAERIEKSLVFCSCYDLPQSLRQAVITHIKYFNDYNYTFDNETVMNSLPNYLQKEIGKHLKRSRLRELDIFKSLSDEVTGQIALKLKSKSCGVGKILFSVGDIGKELFIQRTGRSEVIECDERIGSIGRGDVIGEDAILSKRRINTVRCCEWSEFYVLEIKDIVKVLKKNYNLKEAKSKWLEIKEIIKKNENWQKNQHSQIHPHFVHLASIKNNFAKYVPIEIKNNEESFVLEESPKYEEYERNLQRESEEDEKTFTIDPHAHKPMDFVMNLFKNKKHLKSNIKKAVPYDANMNDDGNDDNMNDDACSISAAAYFDCDTNDDWIEAEHDKDKYNYNDNDDTAPFGHFGEDGTETTKKKHDTEMTELKKQYKHSDVTAEVNDIELTQQPLNKHYDETNDDETDDDETEINNDDERSICI